MKFNSHRSTVYGTNGIVASSQPLASYAGLRILQKGGNAADAAVATAAALNVTEPTSTGIGGDCFTLFYNASDSKVEGVNGSGRAPKELTLTKLAELGYKHNLPRFSVHTVTVPGAAAGWVDTITKFGRLSMEEILEPAIDLATNGFPVAPITAKAWARGVPQLKNGPNAEELLINGRAPREGEIMKNPHLADTFTQLAEHGKAGFYEGYIASAIIDLLKSMDGVMTHEDLINHHSTYDDPISTNYRGYEIYEIPPNGQGLTALIGLNILEEYDLENFNPLSAEYLHLLIESMRLAFADTRWYIADPSKVEVPIDELLSKDYANERRELINMKKATVDINRGSPTTSSDTVYLSVVDGDGNACSFINSNYMGFGTGLIPKNTGFTLQNRGHNFSLDPAHPNALAPEKRPYHTIIPSMITKNRELFASYGVMGGFMQPQGHVQVAANLIDHEMSPQEALDHPRFCIMDGTAGGTIALEEGIPVGIMSKLANMGHPIKPTTGLSRMIFGRGQVILRDNNTGVLAAGSDPRADGLAIAY